jgi:hypothetical protein
VATIAGGPAGLLQRGAAIELAAGTVLHAVIAHDVTLRSAP